VGPEEDIASHGIMARAAAAFGIVGWLEVIDFDRFFGFLSFVLFGLHIQVSVVELFASVVSVTPLWLLVITIHAKSSKTSRNKNGCCICS
jgi:hypothetical protein